MTTKTTKKPTLKHAMMPQVWEHIWRLTAPIVKAYHSDWYHDAVQLSGLPEGEDFVFYLAARECGTSLWVGEDLTHMMNYEKRWTVRGTWTDENSGTWNVTFEERE